jgi:hypothetical protein
MKNKDQRIVSFVLPVEDLDKLKQKGRRTFSVQRHPSRLARREVKTVLSGTLANMTDELYAFHEAGHVVVAEYYNMGVQYVTLSEPYAQLGIGVQTRETLLPYITCAVSGANAALKKDEHLGLSAGGDALSIRRAFVLLNISGDEERLIMAEANRISKTLVEENWSLIEEIAATLIQKKRLERTEILEIMQRHDFKRQ